MDQPAFDKLDFLEGVLRALHGPQWHQLALFEGPEAGVDAKGLPEDAESV